MQLVYAVAINWSIACKKARLFLVLSILVRIGAGRKNQADR